MTIPWGERIYMVSIKKTIPAQTAVLVALWKTGDLTLERFQRHLKFIATGNYREGAAAYLEQCDREHEAFMKSLDKLK